MPWKIKDQRSKIKDTIQKLKLSITFKFLVVFLTFAFLLLTFAQPVQAQQSSTSPQTNTTAVNPYLNPNNNPDVPQNLNTWTQNVMISLMGAMSCQLTGINPAVADQQCLGLDSQTGKIGFVPTPQGQVGGAIGIMGNWIAATFTHPPASTVEYLVYMKNKFGIVQPAYAQGAGTGFNGLQPIAKIWEAFRNITYLAFVIVFVAIGLMIMLRVKIDPRTVMTIQNSIPRIIIGLILVTFSFAIAGFLIDLMYVFIFLIFGLFEGIIANFKANPDPNLVNSGAIDKLERTLERMREAYQSDSVFAVFFHSLSFHETVGGVANALKQSIIVGLGGTAADAQSNAFLKALGGAIGGLGLGGLLGGVVPGVAAITILGTALSPLVGIVVGILTGGLLASVLTLATGGGGGREIIGGAAGLLAIIVIATAIIWVLFRLLIQLVEAYIWILIDIVFAPLWVLGGLFPGSPVSFSAWLRDITAHLSAFPATIFMLLLGKSFIEGFGAAAGSGSAFYAPLIGAQSTEAVKGFIGFGMLLLTPQIVSIVKDALKAPKFPYGAAIGQAVGVGAGGPGGVVGKGSQFGSTLFGLSYLPGASHLPFFQKMRGGPHQPGHTP